MVYPDWVLFVDISAFEASVGFYFYQRWSIGQPVVLSAVK